MSNSFYNHSTYPTPNAPGSSANLRAELDLITAGFNKLPTLSGNGYKVAMVNSAGTALIASSALQQLALTQSTIDSTPIGATTRAAGNFTTLSANGAANLGSAVTIAGGTINNTIIGGTTPAAGYFTTIEADSMDVGTLIALGFVGPLTGNVTGNVTGDVAGNVTTSTGTSTFNNVTISGTLDMNAGTVGTITGLATPTNSSDAAPKSYVDTQRDTRLALAGGTMSGAIAMGANRITGLGDPSSTQDAATKNYTDTNLALKLNLSGGTMSGALAMGANRITGVADPVGNQDAATKAYVDSVAQGLDVKASVRAATTANISLSGTATVDGVALSAGDRVLVKDQSTASQNGIYVVSAGGWGRAPDMDAWGELPGAFVFVEDGSTNDNSGWVCTVAPGGTIGTTAVTFEQFSGAGQINAGAGLTKSGNTLNVGTASSARIVVNANDIDLATTSVVAGTYRSVTVDAYGRVTAGTNPTTLAGYGITDAYTQTQVDTALALKLNLSGGTMSGSIAMGTNRITGLGAPVAGTDATTKTYVDNADALKLNLSGGTMSGAIAMGGSKITGLGEPTANQDAVTLNYVTTLYGSTASAAASASAAATSATNAANSATAAAGSATSAASSASSAATSLSNFRAQYLGPASSNPTVDGNGNALTTGDLYFNTAVGEMRVYNGTSWVQAYLPGSTYVLKAGDTMTGDLIVNANVGIGTSSISDRLTVQGSGNFRVSSGNVGIALSGNGWSYSNYFNAADNSLRWYSSTGGDRVILDASGNLGLGVTPSEWTNGRRALQIGGDVVAGLGFSSSISETYTNAFVNSGEYKYVTTGPAGIFDFNSSSAGGFTWRLAPSGTAGDLASFTQAMTLNASGNLGVGTTSPNGRLQVTDANRVFDSFGNLNVYTSDAATVGAGGAIGFGGANGTGGTSPYVFAKIQGIKEGATNTWNGALLFGTTAGSSAVTERMRIDSAGNVGIGTSSPVARLQVVGAAKVGEGAASNTAKLMVNTLSGTAAGIQLFQDGNESWIIQNPGSTTALTFANSGAERMRLDGVGNLGIGTSSPTERLHVAGALRVTGTQTTAGSGIYLDYGSGIGGTNVYGPDNSTQGIWRVYTATANGGVGSEKMRLDSSGNLGIGTSSPISKLHVFKSSDNQLQLQCDNTGTVTIDMGGTTTPAKGGIRFSDNSGSLFLRTNSTTQATIDSSGNLGLGVTPSAWGTLKSIDVSTWASFAGFTNQVGVLGNAYFDGSNYRYKQTAVATRYEQNNSGVHAWFTAASGTAGNAISFTQAMTLDASGNLGVGVTNPSAYAKSAVVATAGSNAFYAGSSTQGVYIFNSTGTDVVYNASGNSGGSHVWQTGNTERARIDSSGNFGLGINKVFGSGNGYAGNSSAASSATLELWDTNGNTKLYNAWGSGNLLFGTANTERARIDSSGNLLVGATSVAGQGGLTIQPNISAGSAVLIWNRANTTATSYPVDFRNANTTVGFISYTNTATVYSTSSDYRLKEDIQPMTGALAKVAALKPCTYKWKADGSDGEGFIAHELAEVVPQCVTGEKDAVDAEGKPVYQGIDTSFLVATLTAAIQEQQAIIESLKARLDAANL